MSYLFREKLEENLRVHFNIFSEKLQIAGLDVAKLRSHDLQVGHGLWRFLILQIFYQLVEIANNFSHEIFGNLREKIKLGIL